MNIIKNKNFKNHKKVLLIGAFIVCQLFAVSVRQYGGIHQKIVYAANPKDYNAAKTDIQSLFKTIRGQILGEVSYIKGMSQKKLAGIALIDTFRNTKILNNLSHYFALTNNQNIAVNLQAALNLQSDLGRALEKSKGISRYKEGSYITICNYITQALISYFLDYTNTFLSNSQINNSNGSSVSSEISNLLRLIEGMDRDSLSKLPKRIDYLSSLIENLGKVSSKIDQNYSSSVLSHLKNKFGNVAEQYLSWLGTVADGASSANGMIANLKTYLSSFMTDLSNGSSIKKYLIDTIMPKYIYANENIDTDSLMELLEKGTLTNFLTAKGKESLKHMMDEDYRTKAKLTNPGATDAAVFHNREVDDSLLMQNVNNLLSFYLNRSFAVCSAEFGKIMFTPPAGIGITSNFLIKVKPQGVDPARIAGIDASLNPVYRKLASNSPKDLTFGYIVDNKNNTFVLKSLLNILNLSNNISGNLPGSLTEQNIDANYNFIDKLVSSSDLLSSLAYQPPQAPFQDPQLRYQNNNTPYSANTTWYPLTYLLHPDLYKQALENKLNVAVTLASPMSVNDIGGDADTKTLWGKYSKLVHSYVENSISTMKNTIKTLILHLTGEEYTPNPDRKKAIEDAVNVINNILTGPSSRNTSVPKKQIRVWNVLMTNFDDDDRKAIKDHPDLCSEAKTADYVELFDETKWYYKTLSYSEFNAYSRAKQLVIYALAEGDAYETYRKNKYYELFIPEDAKNNYWATGDWKAVKKLWKDKWSKEDYDEASMILVWPFLKIEPFSSDLTKDSLFYDPSAKDNFLDLRTVTSWDEFKKKVGSEAKRKEIQAAWSSNSPGSQVPYWMYEDGKPTPINPPGPGEIDERKLYNEILNGKEFTVGEFWSDKYSESLRDALRNSTNHGLKLRFSQKEYLDRSCANGLLKDIDLYTITPEEFKKLDSTTKSLIKVFRPLYDHMFEKAPFEGEETEPSLAGKDLRKILMLGYSGYLTEWLSLKDVWEEVKDRNGFFNYPPFTSIEEVTSNALDNKEIRELLPDATRMQLFAEEKKRAQEDKEEPEDSYWRKRNWYNYDRYSSNYDDLIEREARTNIHTSLDDLIPGDSSYEISKAELEELNEKVVMKYLDDLLAGNFDKYAKAKEGDYSLNSEYGYYSNSNRKMFRIFVAMSSLLRLKGICDSFTNSNRSATKYKKILSSFGAELKKWVGKSSGLGSSHSDYKKAIIGMIENIMRDRTLKSRNSDLDMEELIKGFCALFNVDIDKQELLINNRKLDQQDINGIRDAIDHGNLIMSGFWDRLSEETSNNDNDNPLIKNLDKKDIKETTLRKQVAIMQDLLYGFKEVQTRISDTVTQMAMNAMNSRASERGKTRLREIDNSNKKPITSSSALRSIILDIASVYNKIVNKKNDLFGSHNNFDNLIITNKYYSEGKGLQKSISDVLKNANTAFKTLYGDLREYESDKLNHRTYRLNKDTENRRRIEGLERSRSNYSRNQHDLLMEIINTAKILKAYFVGDVWKDVSNDKFGEIKGLIDAIMSKMRIDVSDYEKQLSQEKLPIPNSNDADRSIYYNFEKGSDKNPYSQIREILNSNDTDTQKLIEEAKKVNIDTANYDSKSNLYMKLIMDYLSGMYFIQYLNKSLLRNSLLISTYDIDRGSSGKDRSLKDMNYNDSNEKDPISVLEDNITVLLDEYDRLNPKTHFVVDRGSDDQSSSQLKDLRNALEELKTLESKLDESKVGSTIEDLSNKVEEKMADQEESDNADEQDDSVDSDASTDVDSDNEDLEGEEAQDLEEDQEPIISEPVKPQAAPVSVNVNEPIKVSGSLRAQNRATEMPHTYSVLYNKNDNTLSGQLKFAPGGEVTSQLFAVMFENGEKLSENGHDKNIKLTKVDNNTFTFVYKLNNPNALVEFHTYDMSHKDDADGVMRPRGEHFHGSFAISNPIVIAETNGQLPLVKANSPLNGSDQPIDNTNPINTVQYYKKQNGDLVVDLGEMPEKTGLVYCIVPKSGTHADVGINFAPTKLDAVNKWFVQIPQKYATMIKELHCYNHDMKGETFVYKIALDYNLVESNQQNSKAQNQVHQDTLIQPVAQKQAQPTVSSEDNVVTASKKQRAKKKTNKEKTQNNKRPRKNPKVKEVNEENSVEIQNAELPTDTDSNEIQSNELLSE